MNSSFRFGHILLLCCFIFLDCKSSQPLLAAGEFGHTLSHSMKNETKSLSINVSNATVISKELFKSWKSTGILSGNGGVFKIVPGDYRSWGRLDIRKGGSQDQPLTILGVEEDSNHPVRLDEEEQVILEGISIRGKYSHPPNHKERKIIDVEHVIVSGLTISGKSASLNGRTQTNSPDFNKKGGENNRIIFANDISIERCLFENVVSKHAIRIHAKNIKINKCVVRNCYRVPKGDNIGITITSTLSYQSSNIEISDNEIYNCTDAVQIVNRDDVKVDNRTPNVQILNNDMYITEEYKLWKNGKEMASSENGIDLKTGGTKEQPVIIQGNFIRGYRETDTETGGSGSTGTAINMIVNSNYIEISDNIITDTPIGIVIAPKNQRAKRPEITIKNNLIFDLYSSGADDGIAFRGDTGAALLNNTIVNATSLIWSGYTSPYLINNNIIVNHKGTRKWSKYHKANSTNNLWINTKGNIYAGNKMKEKSIKVNNHNSLFDPYEVVIFPLTNPTSITIPYGNFRGTLK